nr:DeoR/GlpR family DNA-binding transcription regulator [Aneurinibacillus sp. XH2]
MIPKKRQEVILEMLKQQKTVSVSEIVQHLRISEMTARRDLEYLESHVHSVVRIRGGAQWMGDSLEVSNTYLNDRFHKQHSRNTEQKTAIGQLAASLVEDDETIIIDAGSTAIQLAKHLDGKRRLTAFVTAVNIAEELEDKEGIMKFLVGGVFRSKTTTLVSPFIEQTLTNIYADKVFIGVTGVSLSHGFTCNDFLEADVKRHLTRSGKEIYWLVDSSKLNAIASFQIAGIEGPHTIITDSGIDPDMKREIGRRCGVLVAERG